MDKITVVLLKCNISVKKVEKRQKKERRQKRKKEKKTEKVILYRGSHKKCAGDKCCFCLVSITILRKV